MNHFHIHHFYTLHNIYFKEWNVCNIEARVHSTHTFLTLDSSSCVCDVCTVSVMMYHEYIVERAYTQQLNCLFSICYICLFAMKATGILGRVRLDYNSKGGGGGRGRVPWKTNNVYLHKSFCVNLHAREFIFIYFFFLSKLFNLAHLKYDNNDRTTKKKPTNRSNVERCILFFFI